MRRVRPARCRLRGSASRRVGRGAPLAVPPAHAVRGGTAVVLVPDMGTGEIVGEASTLGPCREEYTTREEKEGVSACREQQSNEATTPQRPPLVGGDTNVGGGGA